MNRSSKRILVLENGTTYSRWLIDNGFKTKTNIKKLLSVDAVMFTGGADINPSMYSNHRHPSVTHIDGGRDRVEEGIFNICIKNNIPMIGICRGAQFLHVMNGGSLIQNVYGHNQGAHEITIRGGAKFTVTSTHHQMMNPCHHTGCHLIAWSSRPISRVYEYGNKEVDDIGEKEPEVILWKGQNRRSLCIQFHPEQMSKDSQGSRWAIYQVKRLFDSP